jgi:glycosyltransferase involved in cell wall biosynthesis
MEPTQPVLSLIIPVYNAEPFLEECFASILLQNFQKPFEVQVNQVFSL